MMEPSLEMGGEAAATAQAAPRRVIQFILGRELFALPIDDVASIQKVEDITSLPLAPDFIAGVVNLQGRLSAVLTMEKILGGKRDMSKGNGSLIVLVPERKGLALLVDTTIGIADYTILEEVGAEGGTQPGELSLVEGVFRRGPRLISLISTKKLLLWIENEFKKGEG